MPSNTTLERALRQTVQTIYDGGDLAELTVKRVRRATEVDLELREGYFKDNSSWKERSKQIIEAEVKTQEDAAAEVSESAARQVSKAKKPDKNSKSNKAKPSQPAKKRSFTDTSKPKKRRRTSIKSASEDELSEVAESPTEANIAEDKPVKTDKNESQVALATVAQDDESDLSSVLDESPKRKSFNEPKKSVPKQGAKVKPKPKTTKNKDCNSDPDTEEIKRLQGWLGKCGIRKMWYKELAPYDTSKTKIRHLKEMLSDAGMIGKYSNDKANSIREARELAADLEAVQAGAKQWGTADGDDGSESGDLKPKRKLAKGLQAFDFLNDSDGEETD
ncbi:hypothetical protein MMC09_003823 [Bachmanniomyces sp. S44760]|nr:hypothetical protein [Bachmanniomyces sp. S44760]